MDLTRSQNPNEAVDGAASAVPDTANKNVQGDGAGKPVPPSTSRAFREAEATQGGTIQPGDGAVLTVPKRRKGKGAWGRKAVGKPVTMQPTKHTEHMTGPVQAKGRTPPQIQDATAKVASVAEKSSNPELTAATESDPAILRLNAGWSLPVQHGKAKRAKRAEPKPAQPPSTAGYHKKNSKQRRKAREQRLGDQQKTAPASLPSQGAPHKGSAQAAAGPPVAGRTVPKGSRGQNKATKGGSNQGARPSSKRARLDETFSPRGESKRQKTGPHGETPRIAYAEAVKADLLVAVTTATAEHLSPQQSEEIQHQMQGLLIKEAMQPGNSQSEGPQFRGKPVLTNGSLRLWCEDKATLEWLKRSVAAITLSDGQKLVVKRPDELPKRVRVGILLPGIHESPNVVARMLRYQNRWADIDRWLVSKFEVQATETFATLSIPETVVGPLMDHGRRLSFMLGSVYVKFEGPRGKFGENPPAKPTDSTDASRMDTSPTATASATEVTEAVAEPVSQVPEQTGRAPETDEEELLLRDHSESEEGCSEELRKLAIRRKEDKDEREASTEEMSTEETDDDVAVPFLSDL
jgi:hypothetical protein